MAPEDTTIPRRHGGELQAAWYRTGNNPNSTPFVIVCHGFTGDKSEWGRFPMTAERLNEAGFDVVLFDFSGSGKNPREPVLLSHQIRDLEDVYAWAKKQGYTKIATIGLSFGGITSLLAALPDRFAAVFWAPAFYMKRVMGRILFGLARFVGKIRKKPIKIKSANNDPILIDRTFLKDIQEINPDEYLENFTTPALIVQGTEDDRVKPEYTREAFAHMPQDEHHELVEIEGTNHDFDGDYLEAFIDQSIEWLQKYLPR